MIVVIDNIVFHNVMQNKAAMLIKRDGQRAVTCSDLQFLVSISIVLGNKFDQCFAIPSLLKLFCYREVLYFKHTVALIRYDAFTYYVGSVYEYKHRSSVKVEVNHVFLFVCKQK